MKNTPAALIALLVAAAAVHFGVISQDFATLAKNGYLYDDSFYAFQIARNVASGLGPTFDGVNLTNGFQPLYVALLVPIYLIFGSDPVAPIYVALALLALCTVATAGFLYGIVRRYTSERAALLAAMLWALSPTVIRQSANGLETALALCLFAASVHYYLYRIRPEEAPSRGAFIRLGILVGLAILARVDLALFGLTMLLDYLLVMRRRGATITRGALVSIATAFVVNAPWLLYGWLAVGSPLQESGTATRFLAIAYAPFLRLGPHSVMYDGPDASFVWAHVVHSLQVLKTNPVTHVIFRGLQRVTASTVSAETFAVISNVIGVGLLGLFVYWLARFVRGTRRGELTFLLLFSVALVAAYSTWIFGAFFFLRYYYPVLFVSAIFAGLFIEDLLGWLAHLTPARRSVAAGVIGLYLAAFGYMVWSNGFHSVTKYRFYDVAKWVEENTSEDDVIGIFQSGTIGYLSGRRVINLDGKVNRHALVALREGKISEYVSEAGIDIVMDDRKVLELFFGPWNAEEYHRILDTAFCTSADTGVPGWLGYRLTPETSLGSGNGLAGPGSTP